MRSSRLAPLAAFVLAACSPAHDWREVRPEGSALSLLMPCRPSAQARQVAIAGRTVGLVLSACSAGGQTWALAHADVGDPALVSLALDDLRRAAVQNLGAGEPTSVTMAVTGATPGTNSGRWALSGRLPDGTAVQEQLALFARGTVVYQATAVGPALPADALDTFFGSLRLGS